MKKIIFSLHLIAVFNLSPFDCRGQITTFVDKVFNVPDSFVTKHFKLKPLSKKYAEKDYQAVVQSIDHLQGVFGLQSEWPPKNLSLEDNQWDVALHEEEFAKRKSFTYTVISTDESAVIGCVYIYPSSKTGYDTEIAMWVSKPAFENGLDSILFTTIKKWITDKWPFKRVAYPGREISWNEWLKK